MSTQNKHKVKVHELGLVDYSFGINDCFDCNDVPFGHAYEDNCGECDEDPLNDCVPDCNGDWGGTTYLDECGICDDDVSNDCVQDCNGDWGGEAIIDNCRNCVFGNTNKNECIKDCNNIWGGSAIIDNCDNDFVVDSVINDMKVKLGISKNNK